MSAQLTAEAALADPSVVSAAELVDFLTADRAHGLAASEADRRLARDGLNELRSAPPLPAWRRILAQFADPLVYLLLVAIAVSTLAWSIEGGHGLPVDALVIALIALANAILGYSLDSARTAGFTVLVFAQLFNCFNARCARAHAGTCSPTAGSGPPSRRRFCCRSQWCMSAS